MGKKILIISTLQNTIEAFLIPHIKMLEEKGYQVDLACSFTREKNIDLKNNKWIDIPFSRSPLSKENFRAIIELKKLMKNENYDVVHCHTPIASFLGRYLAYKAKVKNILYTAHGFHFFKGAPIKNWLIYYPMEWLAMRWTDKLITINQEDYERAQKMSGRRTKVYKVNGVGLDISKYSNGDREKVRKELRLKEDDYIITIIGELNKNKNQIQLLKALNLLEENYKVILVGRGPEDKTLKEYVEENKTDNRVFFLGYRKDVNDIIAASEVVASMSLREGLPRNLMEAMCQGKPLLVTDIRGNRDIVENEVNGYLFEVDNIEDLKDKIIGFQKIKRYKKIKEKNLESRNRFSNNKILEKMRLVYFG